MSNVIKYFQYVPVEDTKIVEHPAPPVPQHVETEQEGLTAEQQLEMDELQQVKEQIIQDAQAFAEEQVRASLEEASALKEHAQLEIDGWWQERRQLDQAAFAEAKEQGLRQGYEEGRVQAEAELRERYDQMLEEASQILQQAYVLKQDIIQEAEPFLIEMSCSIAEKIVARQLTLEPEWVKDLIRKVLSRRREQGLIALCVAPSQFSYIQDAREELLLHIDSQAELQIIPDGSVQDLGCVIRSSFGSIDARIDTQLNEIKQALQQLASHDEEA
ncbi:FliH/SctL family protein [Paenibacillus puerhi]|uniref:FliH/SctL family protein n=1 Tax=Paenibacillus puerhi TaxID=2692622 RepID=UPI00135BF006|nr:FliH/SctL family protein [Paenibacillus puerhi]